GFVRETGYRYVGGLNATEIHVDRRSATGLPFIDGQRVDITLSIGDEHVRGGLRATPDNPVVWISPDVRGAEDVDLKLAEVLGRNGFAKNDPVILSVDGNNIRVTRAG